MGQDVEHEQRQVARHRPALAKAEGGPERGEVRVAALVHDAEFAVQHAGTEGFQFNVQIGKAPAPVVAVAAEPRDASGGDVHLHPVAVELDLMDPAWPGRRRLLQRQELVWDVSRKLGDSRHGESSQVATEDSVASPPARLTGGVQLPLCERTANGVTDAMRADKAVKGAVGTRLTYR